MTAHRTDKQPKGAEPMTTDLDRAMAQIAADMLRDRPTSRWLTIERHILAMRRMDGGIVWAANVHTGGSKRRSTARDTYSAARADADEQVAERSRVPTMPDDDRPPLDVAIRMVMDASPGECSSAWPVWVHVTTSIRGGRRRHGIVWRSRRGRRYGPTRTDYDQAWADVLALGPVMRGSDAARSVLDVELSALGYTPAERRRFFGLPIADDPLFPLCRALAATLGRDLTLQEIGEIYGVSRERIRQLEERAIRKITRDRGLREYERHLSEMTDRDVTEPEAFGP